jgi:hypothetical protein
MMIKNIYRVECALECTRLATQETGGIIEESEYVYKQNDIIIYVVGDDTNDIEYVVREAIMNDISNIKKIISLEVLNIELKTKAIVK